MVSSGIPFARALFILEQQSSCKALKEAACNVRHAIQDGETIANAMRRSPRVFNDIYTSLISAGENSGTLENSLQTLCASLQAWRMLKSRMMTAAMYPLIVLATLAVVTILLLVFVIPTFEELYAESHTQLPWLTRAVLLISRTFLEYWHIGILVVALTFVVTAYTAGLRQSKNRLHAFVAKMPIIRPLLQNKYAAQWARLLSSLVRAGIPILDGLAIARDSMDDIEAARQIESMRERLLEGHSLSQSCTGNSIFPPLVSQMVAIGEETGQLESMLSKTASFYEQEMETTIEKLKQAAEPCLVLMIGAIVGTLVLAMYLPIFQLGEVAQIR